MNPPNQWPNGARRADIFVSYAHRDDHPLGEAEHGWVTQLRRDLQGMLEQQLQIHDAFIWMDHQLAESDVLDASLAALAKQSKVLLATLSPSYCASAWCNRELGEHVQAAVQAGRPHGVVAIELFQSDATTALIMSLNRSVIRFWSLDPETHLPMRFGFPPHTEERRKAYWSAVNRLAVACAKLISGQAVMSPPRPESLPVLPALAHLTAQVRLPSPDRFAPAVPLAEEPEQGEQESASGGSDVEGLQLFVHAGPEDQANLDVVMRELRAAGAEVIAPVAYKGANYLDHLRAFGDSMAMADGVIVLHGNTHPSNPTVAFQVAKRARGNQMRGAWGAVLKLKPGAPIPVQSPSLAHIDCSAGFRLSLLAGFLRGLRALSDGATHA